MPAETVQVHPTRHHCRVLHVLGRLSRGGAELRTLEVLEYLAPRGITGDVLALSGQPGELDGEIVRLGGAVIPLRRGPGFHGQLHRVLLAGRYDAIHSHVHHYSGVLLKAAHRAGIPVRIAQYHSLNDGQGEGLPRRLYRWWMRRLIDRHATTILGVSRTVLSANWPWHQGDVRCQVIYNGVDSTALTKSAGRDETRSAILGHQHPHRRLIIHVGNLTPPKNHPLLLATFEALASRHGDVHLVVVGHGEPTAEKDLRHRIAVSPASGRIHYLGRRSDVASLLVASDAFLFPSLREGLPGALVEACAAGLPCLASDIGPCREVADGIPLVRLQALEAGAEAWAMALDEHLRSTMRLPIADAIHLVEEAGFSIASASDQYARLWRGGAA